MEIQKSYSWPPYLDISRIKSVSIRYLGANELTPLQSRLQPGWFGVGEDSQNQTVCLVRLELEDKAERTNAGLQMEMKNQINSFFIKKYS